MARTFTPRDIVALIKEQKLPAVIMQAWGIGTKEIVADVAATCVQRQIGRKICSAIMAVATLFLIWLALYGMNHSNPTADWFTHTQTDAEVLFGFLFVVAVNGALGTGSVTWAFFRDESPTYNKFTWGEDGFGRNLSWLLEILKKTLEELHSIRLWELGVLATDLLVERAKLVIQAEREIRKRMDENYRKPDWKYDPDWDKAKKGFDTLFDMFERFGITDPKGHEMYYRRAETELNRAN